MSQQYLTLDKIECYTVSHDMSNYVWDEVIGWDHFKKNTVGQQLVRSADSISANISEGFGRYHKKDKIKFYRYAQGSLIETIDWIKKAESRKLIQGENLEHIKNEINKLPKAINSLIKYTNEKLKI